MIVPYLGMDVLSPSYPLLLLLGVSGIYGIQFSTGGLEMALLMSAISFVPGLPILFPNLPLAIFS